MTHGPTRRPRAEDSYVPAEDAKPFGQERGAVRPPVKTEGNLHLNAYGKPCLAYAASSRVTNKCPSSIRLQICQKDSSGCSSAVVPAYQYKDVVMGYGPGADFFEYIAKEAP
jgi:hypothetical protein